MFEKETKVKRTGILPWELQGDHETTQRIHVLGGETAPEDERGASREGKLKDNGVAGEAWDKRAQVSQELQKPKRQKQAKSADTIACREAALFRQGGTERRIRRDLALPGSPCSCAVSHT